MLSTPQSRVAGQRLVGINYYLALYRSVPASGLTESSPCPSTPDSPAGLELRSQRGSAPSRLQPHQYQLLQASLHTTPGLSRPPCGSPPPPQPSWTPNRLGSGLRGRPEAGTWVQVGSGSLRPPHKTQDTFGKGALCILYLPRGQRPSSARSRAMTASSNLIMSVVPLCQCAVTLAGKPLCVSTASTMPAVKLAQLSVLFSLGTEM